MKQVEIKLNISAVAPLLDVIKRAADDLRGTPRDRRHLPRGGRGLHRDLAAGADGRAKQRRAGIAGAVRHGISSTTGRSRSTSNNCESLLRACAAVRIRIVARWLQGVPPEIIEDEDAPVAEIPEELRLPFAAYTFLDQIQKIILEHLNPLATE